MAKHLASYRNEPITIQTGREEILLLLFRNFSPLQQRELISEMRALFDANRVVTSHLGGKLLKNVGEDYVQKCYGTLPSLKSHAPKQQRGTSHG